MRKLPINRVNKFFSEDEFNLDIQMGREAIEEDNNFTIVLFRVDLENSNHHDLYGESKKGAIQYKTPIELIVTPVIEETQNLSYNNNGSQRNLEDGNFIFEIYQKQLEEMGINIQYGDYVGYNIDETTMRYYSVSNDGIKNYDNMNTIMGYKPAFRKIVCTPVNENEFNGK